MRKKESYLKSAQRHEKKGDLGKAKELYERSLRIQPSEKTHEKLGLLLNRIGQIEEAREHLERALEFNPGNFNCIYNLGIIERIEGKYDSSMARYMLLKRLGVENSVVDMSMGVLLSEIGEPRLALDYYKSALERDSSNEILLFNYSLCLMTLGEYEEGLKMYEKRIWHAKPPGDQWNGERDANVMVVPEQGNGDIIQFSRYIGKLKERCNKTILLCNAPLVDLMRSVHGVDEVVEFNPGDEFVQAEKEEEDEDSVRYGNYVRIMSIPYVLGINPPEEKYEKHIFADPKKTEDFKARMSDSKKLKIGICWQGGKRKNPEMMAIDKRRSMPLSEMSPILIEEVEFYSLQKEDNQNKDFPFIKDMMKDSNDFTDTAAIIENMDLVISVDTAVAHLSASMGKPTWMLSRKGGCWRWGMCGESTFWYPSMRIFRQEMMNCWKSAISNVAEELKKFVQAKNTSITHPLKRVGL